MKKAVILSFVAAAMLSCGKAGETTLSVVPYPNEVEVKSGTFDASGADFRYSSEFDEDAILEVAKLALERNTGARGLRAIMESAMMDAIYVLFLRNLSRKPYQNNVVQQLL